MLVCFLTEPIFAIEWNLVKIFLFCFFFRFVHFHFLFFLLSLFPAVCVRALFCFFLSSLNSFNVGPFVDSNMFKTNKSKQLYVKLTDGNFIGYSWIFEYRMWMQMRMNALNGGRTKITFIWNTTRDRTQMADFFTDLAGWLNEQSATSFASLTSKPTAIAQQSQQQGTTATPSILSNVSCIQVTRDTGKKRAADSDVLQSMVYLQNATSMRCDSQFDRIETNFFFDLVVLR